MCIAVHQLPKGGKVEIDAIAVVNEESNEKSEKVPEGKLWYQQLHLIVYYKLCSQSLLGTI